MCIRDRKGIEAGARDAAAQEIVEGVGNEGVLSSREDRGGHMHKGEVLPAILVPVGVAALDGSR